MSLDKIFSGILSFIPKKMTDIDVVTYRIVCKFVTSKKFQYHTISLYYPMEFTRKWYQRKATWNFIKEYKFPFYHKVYCSDSGYAEKYIRIYNQKKNSNLSIPVGEIDFDRYQNFKTFELGLYGERLSNNYTNTRVQAQPYEEDANPHYNF